MSGMIKKRGGFRVKRPTALFSHHWCDAPCIQCQQPSGARLGGVPCWYKWAVFPLRLGNWVGWSRRASLHPGCAGTQAHATNTEALKAARAAGRLLSHNTSDTKSTDAGSKHLAHEDVFAGIFILNQHRSWDTLKDNLGRRWAQAPGQ